jgi:hypothetical protein
MMLLCLSNNFFVPKNSDVLKRFPSKSILFTRCFTVCNHSCTSLPENNLCFFWLLFLGLPWTIQTLLVGVHEPSTENLMFFLLFLCMALALSFLFFFTTQFVLTRPLCIWLCVLYGSFVMFTLFVVEDL